MPHTCEYNKPTLRIVVMIVANDLPGVRITGAF
jgi:hypothetical protein